MACHHADRHALARIGTAQRGSPNFFVSSVGLEPVRSRVHATQRVEEGRCIVWQFGQRHGRLSSAS